MPRQVQSEIRTMDRLYDQSNLSHTQLAIWAGQKIAPTSPHYNMAFRFRIAGDLDVDVFRSAFSKLVELSPSLRTYIVDHDGTPQQKIRPSVEFSLPVIEKRGGGNPDLDFDDWETQFREQSFDLETRLFDSVLVRSCSSIASEDESETIYFDWYLNQHHLITDGVSLGILYRRMENIYQAMIDDQAMDVAKESGMDSYRDAEREIAGTSRFEKVTEYWRGQVAPETELSFYGKRNTGKHSKAKRIEGVLDARHREALKTLSASPTFRGISEELSLFNVITSVLSATVHHISNSDEIVISAPMHSRHLPEFRNTVGPLVEFYPLHVQFSADTTFASLAQSVASESGGMLLNSCPGASKNAGAAKSDVLLNFITGTIADFGPWKTTVDWRFSNHVDPSHALRVQVSDFHGAGEFQIAFDMNESVFTDRECSDFVEHFRLVIDAMASDIEQKVRSVDMLLPGQDAWIGSPSQTPVASRNVRLPLEAFKEQVDTSPTNIAIVNGSREWSFQQLDDHSDALAAELLQQQVAPGDRVAICLKRSEHAIISILAAMKVGAVYVPMDRADPSERMNMVLADCQPVCVLSDSSTCNRLGGDVPKLEVDKLGSSEPAPGLKARLKDRSPSAGDTAYIIYTSGSTGVPKGVAIQHAALANYVTWAGEFYAKTDRLSFPLFSNLAFDLTVTSIFVPLVTGGEIVVYPETGDSGDLAILDVIDDNRVDIVKLTPSHLELIKDRNFQGTRIRQFILGGEDLPRDLARQICDRFPDGLQIHNEYGPTEATVGCIVQTFDPASDVATSVVPIGLPIRNLQVMVANENLNPVPRGVTGELCIAGEGLALGYWGDHAANDRFVEDDAAPAGRLYRTGDLARVDEFGKLHCLGRIDNQVKLRGARIELGEVEAAMKGHPSVDSCVAHLAELGTENQEAAVKHCVRCGLPSNYPNALFDENDVCDSCLAFDGYKDRAEAYFRTPDDLLRIVDASRRTRQREYDAIALLSGGKDSTYALCKMVDLGMRVLAFTLDNGYLSDEAKANIRRVTDQLGVEHIFGTTPAMNSIFVDSMQRHANVCHGCFKTVYTLSLQLAVERKIPMIVTGLSRGQLFETRLTRELFEDRSVVPQQIDDMVLEARKAYHRIDDAVRQNLGHVCEDESVFEDVQFVDFYRYTDVSLDEMLAYLDKHVPWVRPSDTGRSTNCLINDVGIFVHRRQRGFHNYALPYSWDVRLGHKTRDEALAELDDHIDIQYVKRVLQEVGYDDFDVANARNRLVAYYTGEHELPASSLREYLSDRLPATAIPTVFVHLKEVPLTANGKVDRGALPAVDSVRRLDCDSFVAARNKRQRTLVSIWSKVLGIDQIGIRDNFFELGGDSIAAIQIAAIARFEGVSLAPTLIFRKLTIEQLDAELADAPTVVKRTSALDDEPEKIKTSSSELAKVASLLQLADREAQP